MKYYKRFSDRRAYIKLMWSCPECVDIGGATTYNYGVDLEGDPTYVLSVMGDWGNKGVLRISYKDSLERVTNSTIIKDYWEF